jgi:hypothetical protein
MLKGQTMRITAQQQLRSLYAAPTDPPESQADMVQRYQQDL